LCPACVNKTKFSYEKKVAQVTGHCAVKTYCMGMENPPRDNVLASLPKDNISFIGTEQSCQCFRGYVSHNIILTEATTYWIHEATL
jgi:hypothetical protein